MGSETAVIEVMSECGQVCMSSSWSTRARLRSSALDKAEHRPAWGSGNKTRTSRLHHRHPQPRVCAAWLRAGTGGTRRQRCVLCKSTRIPIRRLTWIPGWRLVGSGHTLSCEINPPLGEMQYRLFCTRWRASSMDRLCCCITYMTTNDGERLMPPAMAVNMDAIWTATAEPRTIAVYQNSATSGYSLVDELLGPIFAKHVIGSSIGPGI